MKKQSSLWGSISILIAAVIAILAFVRGKWGIPLLISAFALWGTWVLCALALPKLRVRKKKRAATKSVEADVREASMSTLNDLSDYELIPILLRHVNHRISAQLKTLYPQVRWEWKVKDPAYLVSHGGIGRIRVYGISNYDYADVELDRNGHIACSMVTLLDAEGSGYIEPPILPSQNPVDPQVWYETQGRKTLETMIADLDSRGHNSLTLREDGSIYVCPAGTGDESVQGTLREFPQKSTWDKLVKVLEQVGLAATAGEDSVTVAW